MESGAYVSVDAHRSERNQRRRGGYPSTTGLQFDLPVGAVTHAISGAVEPGCGIAAERVANKSLGRQLGPVQITSGHTGAADESNSWFSNGTDGRVLSETCIAYIAISRTTALVLSQSEQAFSKSREFFLASNVSS